MKSSCIVLAIALILPSLTYAYVNPSFYVLSSLAKKHSPLDEGRFRHKISVYRGNELVRTYVETVAINNPEKAYIRIVDIDGNELVSHSRKNFTADAKRPPMYDLLYIRDKSTIYERFKSLGLPVKSESDLYSEKKGAMPYKPEDTVGITRFDGRAVQFVGDPSFKGTQLWVENTPGTPPSPVRAIFPSLEGSSQTIEYRFSRFLEYRVGKDGSMLYPAMVQVLRNGELWAKIETQEVKIGPGASSLDSPKSKQEPDGDTKDFFEYYFKWVR